MPLDFRYHLASLTAVFGALLLGILLGVAMSDAPSLSDQIRQLRQEFKRSQALREIDQQTDQFNEKVEPALVRDRLLGRNVALVYDSAIFPERAVNALRQSLITSGANIALEVSIKPALLQSTPEQLLPLYQQAGLPLSPAPTAVDALSRLGQDIGRGWTHLGPTLLEQKLIRMKGDITTQVSMVIFLGGGSQPQDRNVIDAELAFMRACKERSLRVAAVEALEAPSSTMTAYQKVASITVDNADRAAGRIALILALSSEQNGDYGYKTTADAVAPDVE